MIFSTAPEKPGRTLDSINRHYLSQPFRILFFLIARKWKGKNAGGAGSEAVSSSYMYLTTIMAVHYA